MSMVLLGVCAIFFGVIVTAVAVLLQLVPNIRFLRNAQEFRCRIRKKRLVSKFLGSDAGVSHAPSFEVELLSPPELKGKVVSATDRVYGISSNRFYNSKRKATDRLNAFMVGEEYSCWFDPKRLDQVTLSQQADFTGVIWGGLLGVFCIFMGFIFSMAQ